MLNFFRTPLALSTVMFQGWALFNVDLTRFIDLRSSESAEMVFLSLLFFGFNGALQLLTLWIAPRDTVKALVMPACLVFLFFVGMPVLMAVVTIFLPIMSIAMLFSGEPGVLILGVILLAFVALNLFVLLAADEKANGRPARDALRIIGIR